MLRREFKSILNHDLQYDKTNWIFGITYKTDAGLQIIVEGVTTDGKTVCTAFVPSIIGSGKWRLNEKTPEMESLNECWYMATRIQNHKLENILSESKDYTSEPFDIEKWRKSSYLFNRKLTREQNLMHQDLYNGLKELCHSRFNILLPGNLGNFISKALFRVEQQPTLKTAL